MYSNLGQRMIFFRPKNDPKKARERARQNRDKQKVMRAELHDVAMRFIESMLKVKDANGLPTTPDNIAEEMGELFDFLAIARTTIHHDSRTGDIDELPEPEFPTRIANTVGRLMEVHAMIHGREEVNEADMAFGCRIISDNIPSMRWKILRALTTEWQHTGKISKDADLPPRAVKYHIDEMVALGLVKKLLKDELENSMDHRFDYFKLSEMAAQSLEKYDTRIRIDDIMKDELNKVIEEKNISLSNPCVISPDKPEEQTPSKLLVDGSEGEEKEEHKAVSHAGKDDPGVSQFKTSMAKRRCCLCGRSFLYDLTPYFNNGQRGYICGNCHIQGPPPAPEKADSQTQIQ
jgi:hypothetical protein